MSNCNHIKPHRFVEHVKNKKINQIGICLAMPEIGFNWCDNVTMQQNCQHSKHCTSIANDQQTMLWIILLCNGHNSSIGVAFLKATREKNICNEWNYGMASIFANNIPFKRQQ